MFHIAENVPKIAQKNEHLSAIFSTVSIDQSDASIVMMSLPVYSDQSDASIVMMSLPVYSDQSDACIVMIPPALPVNSGSSQKSSTFCLTN